LPVLTPLPLALSDDLPLQDQHRYLQRVAELLCQQREIGDSIVARVCCEAQELFFDPPAETRRPGPAGNYA
jgi:hypothetical protein